MTLLLRTLLGGINFLMGCRRRKYAIRLYCFDRCFDGGRADIQVSESDFSYDFTAGYERELATVNARDSCLCPGDGDRERFIWPGSELGSRGYAATTLIIAARMFRVQCSSSNA